MTSGPVDVAVVGGGPAGSVLATLLARSGREVVLFERSHEPAWRACGVFSSPAAVARLRVLGLGDETLDAVSRPIPAMRVETPRGTSFRLTYGDDGSLRASAVGFARPALDRALLDMAVSAGASVRPGVSVNTVDVAYARPVLAIRNGNGEERLSARVVVGADGIRSIVARGAGVVRTARFAPRLGLTFHVADPAPELNPDARMVVLDGAYCGLAPVPDGRVNVGIVLAGGSWRKRLAAEGAQAVANRVLAAVPQTLDTTSWRHQARCDQIEGAFPLGHRVARRAGTNWLLIGDAAGFLDPFTGEGLHRALVSAELAALAIERHLDRGRSLRAYDDAMARRFRTKDLVTLVVQAFLARPSAFEYAARRLADRAITRETMGLVMGDLLPASRALDPRFLAALLRP